MVRRGNFYSERSIGNRNSRGGLPGFVLGLAGSSLAAAALLFIGGFLSFINLISHSTPGAIRADAIVVLTGGDDRLATGMTLLTGGKGQRLLVSGVNPDIDRPEIRKLIETSARAKFDCCVDLDKSATNTIGNAEETAIWAASHGYSSVLVVTASYHMPRALGELERAAPGLTLIAHPVYPEGVHLKDWWRWPGSARLLMSEYMKYLAMQLRFRLKAF